ncbi:MarR family transcriptional regulator [Streptomyces galbus]|uniref:MarR family transcriptional regulator n=2 Tax=Streptomyces galbus TaxID=33898 RepID=A0ABX1IF48_STRGB|nr:MarR family transcriptional regulator [Streptomyces galbus]
MLGVIVAEIALSVLVYDLTGSALLSALTFALGFLPYVVGGTLLAGVADRFPARRVLVVCDLVCAACVAPMAAPGASIGVLLALRCCLATVSPVFSGTRTATLADILGDGDLFVLGRSLLRITAQSALLVGYGLGGLLLTVVAPRRALLITVAPFLASAALLRLGTARRPARADELWKQRWGSVPAMAAITSIMRAHQILLAEVDAVVKPYGLTFARYEALVLLTFSKEGELPMSKIGERLMVHPTSVTNTVDRLVRSGLVAKRPNPNDGRGTLAVITDKGREVVEAATRDLMAMDFGLGAYDAEECGEIFALLRPLRVAAHDFDEQ